ncbi:MAG: hypothetical protein R3F43_05615 [bacterium]
MPAEAGTPDAGGRCIDGACEAAGPCDFSPAVVVCDPGVMFGDELCVVRPVDPGLTTCAAVCELGGAECVSATRAAPGAGRLPGVACPTAASSCSQPPPAVSAAGLTRLREAGRRRHLRGWWAGPRAASAASTSCGRRGPHGGSDRVGKEP